LRAVTIELRPLTRADAAAHCAGEDEQTVRWLTGGYGNDASVRVARTCGFSYARDFVSTTDTHDDGTPVTLSLYLLEL
jgi:hypothetical protein